MMLLSPLNICYYLLDRGLIQLKDLVNGDYTVNMSSSRNNNFIINKKLANPIFVKQPRTLSGEQANSVRIEASCYWLANHDEAYHSLKSFLPKYHGYDYLNHVLMTECVKDSTDLYTFYAEKKKFIPAVPTQLAALLSSYHQKIFSENQRHKSEQLFKKGFPFIFHLGDKNIRSWWKPKKESEKQMLSLIEKDDNFRQLIENAAKEWKADGLIHNDIKSANFLINVKDLEKEDIKVRLIDWELADLGDSCWDVAAVFKMYILFWIYSQDFSKKGLTQQKPYHDFDLFTIQSSIQIFWKNYCQQMKVEEDTKGELLLKIAKFAALGLVQSCFETTTVADSLTPEGAQMLQLSVNILRNPEQALVDVFGFESKMQNV